MEFVPLIKVTCVDIYDNEITFYFDDDEYFEIKLDILVDRKYAIKEIKYTDTIERGF